VKHVCPTLPQTSLWKKGSKVKDTTGIAAGTVIATFDDSGNYLGHAAVYVSKNDTEITVYDQYQSGSSPQPIGQHAIRYGGNGIYNGDKYYIVEKK
jgi:hypothetical protein